MSALPDLNGVGIAAPTPLIHAPRFRGAARQPAMASPLCHVWTAPLMQGKNE